MRRASGAELESTEPVRMCADSTTGEPVLVLDRLSKQFGRGSSAVAAVSEVTLALEGGEVVLLLGANGAGKSTLLRMIAGLIEPTSGEIVIGGLRQLGGAHPVQREIGWCSSDERSFYPRLSARENLRLFAALRGLDRKAGDERIGTLTEVLGLAHALDRPFQACSTGERQKLNLVRALVHEPRLCLLDEPTRSLDATARAALARVLSEYGARRDRLVLIASHDFEGLEQIAKRAVILDKGCAVLSGTIGDIAARAGEASWQVTFQTGAARDRAIETCTELKPGLSSEIALAPAPPHSNREMPRALAALMTEHGREIERVVRRAGPSFEDLLVRIASGERIGGPTLGSAGLRSGTDKSGLEARAPQSSAGETPALRRAGVRPRPSAWRVLAALARRDRLVFQSYRFQIGLRLGMLAAWVLSLYFVAQLVDTGSPEVARLLSGDYFTYALLGMAFLRISQVCLVQMASTLREEQLQGTVEPMAAIGEPSWLVLIGGLVWPLASEIAGLSIVFGTGAVLLGADLSSANAPAFLFAAAATILAMIEWGLLSAAFTIAFKRGDPVALLVNLISIGLSGVYFPVELLPAWLHPLSHVLPLTWGLEAVRAAVMHGAGFGSPEYTHALLGMACLIGFLAPVSVWCQRRAFAYARRCGSLTQV